MELSGLTFLHLDSRMERIYMLPGFDIKTGFELFEQVISQKQAFIICISPATSKKNTKFQTWKMTG